MKLRHSAYIVGAFEHPTRLAPDTTTAELHAEVAAGALADAGLGFADVDGYFCAGDAPGLAVSMADYLGLSLRHFDTTEGGGASYVLAVAHAAAAISAGSCRVALITLAGRPRSERPPLLPKGGEVGFEPVHGISPPNVYALAAMRHMHEFGTTPEQLAWIKVAASEHARHNPHALHREPVTVADVLASPMVADPLHRLDCCVVTDGGGALVVVAPEIARSLDRPLVGLAGASATIKTQRGGHGLDLTVTGVAKAGAEAMAQAGVTPGDIRYASVYDSFTITLLLQLEDLGFCAKGAGGGFVADGALISGVGRLAVNTDGGGLCNNHPVNRGGMTKTIEAVRQLRGEAHPRVQVPDCALAVVTGIGGLLTLRHAAAVAVLERE